MGNRFWRKSQMVSVPSWLPVATICSCPGCLSTHSKALWSSILEHPSSQTKATLHAQCPFKPLASPWVSTPSYLRVGVHTVCRPTLHQYAHQHWNSMQTNTAPVCIPTLHQPLSSFTHPSPTSSPVTVTLISSCRVTLPSENKTKPKDCSVNIAMHKLLYAPNIFFKLHAIQFKLLKRHESTSEQYLYVTKIQGSTTMYVKRQERVSIDKMF